MSQGEVRGDKDPPAPPLVLSLLPPAAAMLQCTRLPAPGTWTPRANPEGLAAEGEERGMRGHRPGLWAVSLQQVTGRPAKGRGGWHLGF